MRYQPERALKQSRTEIAKCWIVWIVEMRYQPERALKQCHGELLESVRVCRNEISAREGIETRSAATA